MKDYSFSNDLLNLAINLQNFCQGSSSKELNKEIFSIKFKILFLIKKYEKVSPKILCKKLNMAKSNVALFCKQLLNENLIISTTDDIDRRVIYYCLTSQGVKYVCKFLNLLNNHICQTLEQNKLKDIEKNINTLNELFD